MFLQPDPRQNLFCRSAFTAPGEILAYSLGFINPLIVWVHNTPVGTVP